MYTHHCHNTKHVHAPLSQYKTYTHHCHNTKRTRTTVTIQNMYTHHCHNTKRTRTTVTIQNVHAPLSQYRTRTRTTVTIQNTYTHHCHNTKRTRTTVTTGKERVQLAIEYINNCSFGHTALRDFHWLAVTKHLNLVTSELTMQENLATRHLVHLTFSTVNIRCKTLEFTTAIAE